jgi:hypothetical protein
VISFSFNLSWPWFKEFEVLHYDYFYRAWHVTKHKTLELQISRGGDTIIGGGIDWHVTGDHAGVTFDFSLFRRFIHVSFCDNRHWNYDENRYVNYDNPEEVEKYW